VLVGLAPPCVPPRNEGRSAYAIPDSKGERLPRVTTGEPKVTPDGSGDPWILPLERSLVVTQSFPVPGNDHALLQLIDPF
jgi:hypothetical protein